MTQIRRVALSFGLMTLAACTTLETNTDELQSPSVQEQLDDLGERLSSLSDGLDSQYQSICKEQNAELESELKKNESRISKLRKENSSLEKSCAEKTPLLFGNQIVVGEIENITLVEEGFSSSARIDTGAETSSLGVYDLRAFERDGKQWVRFKLENKKSAASFEYRVRGRARIKQSAISEGDERYEIRLSIRLGDKTYARQIFNLSDRSFLEHQILIGRSFLTDVAVVDTASRYRLGRK